MPLSWSATGFRRSKLPAAPLAGGSATPWAVIWGVAKCMGGGKRTRERALPKLFGTPPKELLVGSVVDFCTEEKQSTDT